MREKLEFIYQVLKNVLPNKVFYGTNLIDNLTVSKIPFIVYQEISNFGKIYADDCSLLRESTIQITLVTENKDLVLEKLLEDELVKNNIQFQMITEFFNSDNSVNRVYEIKMEVIRNE